MKRALTITISLYFFLSFFSVDPVSVDPVSVDPVSVDPVTVKLDSLGLYQGRTDSTDLSDSWYRPASWQVGLVRNAEAGVLLRGRQRIRARLRVRPRMNLFMRYPSSAKILGRTNPNLGGRNLSLDASRQIEDQQEAEADYYKKYMKWRAKEVKAQQRALDKARKEHERRKLAAKKAAASQVRSERKAKSIQDAPLNPWFSSKKKTDSGGVLDLQKDKAAEEKAKDPNRRVPLLKQIWRAIFG